MICLKCKKEEDVLLPAKDDNVCSSCFAQFLADALSKLINDGSRYTGHIVKRDK